MTNLTKLGEFGLIERFRKAIKLDSTVVKGSGDDCAVLKFDRKNYQLFTCDMLVEDVDFTLKDRPYLIGRKSLAVSLSDIAACGGLPRHCLVSIGMPKKTTLKFLDEVFSGMLELAKKYKVNISGGDLSRADKLVIDVSMLGAVEKKKLVLREGAKIGDIIFVSGPLGGSIRGKHLKFTPRIKEARFLVSNFKINSMIDISDGLSQDLGHILKASRVGAVIYEDLIPLPAESAGLNDALYSGEDFELLFTLSKKEAKRLTRKKKMNFQPIGEITSAKSGLRLINKDCRDIEVLPAGFRHF
ncbi:MAG: thiamine-phosphate kinase [Candidatus Omnitrophica bacterium]|nr:thiamine-phosphate kinase [Candidatus Omnitrophota bacterium]